MNKSRLITAVSALILILIAGCSATSGSQNASSSPANASAGADRTDALKITGPSTADTVPDMKPAVDEASPSLPVTITDASGERVTVDSAERVLSLDLYGTLTDTIIGLGLDDRLVGRSNSDTQDGLKDLPVVTQDGHDLNVEAVLELNPDLVLTNTTIGSESVYRKLEAAGVTVVRFDEVPKLSEIGPAIHTVGQALGLKEEAQQLAKQTENELDKAGKHIDAYRAATSRKPRGMVLYVRGTAGVFFILGAEYGAGDVLNILGLEDVAKENDITTLKPANAESLVSLDPEIVLAMEQGVKSTGGVDGLLERPGMSATTAGAHQRVVTAADNQLLSYGPRTPDNLVALAKAIYTEPSDN